MVGVIKAIEVERLSTEYSVRKLTETDIPAIPPGKSKGDNYFVGFFKGCELIAVMDLIAQYPDKETAFIGLLMVDEKFQHAGVGTAILSDSLRCLQDAGYTRIQLWKIYPRSQGHSTVYLKNIVTDSSIEVGEYSMYDDFVRDPRDFQRNNVLYHYPECNHDKLKIG